MRVRLQWVVPLTVALIVAAGFVIAAIAVADAVRGALLTVPGLTRARAVEAAVAAVVVAGTAVTVVAALAGVLLSRMIARPLRRMRPVVAGFTELRQMPISSSRFAEIHDLARGLDHASAELRDRRARDRRERSELTGLLDSISEGILQVDGEGRVARVNPAGRTLLGLPEDAVGRPVAAVLRSEVLRRAVERAGGGAATAVEEVVVDGRRLLVSAAPQPSGGAVATLVDLTDLRRLEEVRRDFVANASHELKTPLTSIRGYTETLLTGEPPAEERRQFLTVVARNAERLQRIIDDLLDLSRLDSGRWEPRPEAVGVADLARAAWLPFSDRAAEREVDFVLESEDEHSAIADRRALEHVFTNLYDNALRYTPRGGRIRVTSRRTSQLQDSDRDSVHWLVIEVADTGAGIPRDSIPRIFERFYRVDPARSRAEGGTGLGLAIVKHMLEAMGGGIEADSALGRGTTIRFWLPAADRR